MTERRIQGLLQALAQRAPADTAYTFVDYEVDPRGLPESLTWAQLHQRVRVVADTLSACGSVGDRAAIVAPQGLEYIVAFLGAIQAGFIAVPLSVPQFGNHDERVSGALRDCSPAAVLTTSAVVEGLMNYAKPQPGRRAPQVIEVDALDFDAVPMYDTTTDHAPKTAYLQYTSGSTRSPTGVMVTHENAIANVEQLVTDILLGVPPRLTVVSWLPLFHDMGLVVGVFISLVAGRPAVLMSPTAFMQRPGRWMQAMAIHSETFAAAPNFAFELAARRTSDDDMAGLDLSDVRAVVSGSERIHAPTIRRFYDRFSRFNLPAAAVRPAYGLAEATVYVVSSFAGQPPLTARFDYDKLSMGRAERCDDEGLEMVSCGPPRACSVLIIDPQTRMENPAGTIGEIWLLGENIASGYWHNAALSDATFGAELVNPSPETPVGPWLRTGDLGVMSEGELFVVGRIKDLLIVNGRNHYPDDIEATVRDITGGRVAAISVPDGHTEKLVVIADVKVRPQRPGETPDALRALKREVTAAISSTHNLRLADLVLVPPGSIPVTTSGKVRRASCIERYQEKYFDRLGAGP
jgi:long-chain fatty acid adenylase/transferase FadD26